MKKGKDPLRKLCDERRISWSYFFAEGFDIPLRSTPTILGRKDIEQAYRTGRGKIKTRAVSEIETMDNGKSRIIVTELPYMVNKAKLVEKIASLVKEKKVDGITDLRDESDQEGTRVVIEVRRDANANVILNQLYKPYPYHNKVLFPG